MKTLKLSGRSIIEKEIRWLAPKKQNKRKQVGLSSLYVALFFAFALGIRIFCSFVLIPYILTEH